MAPMHPIISRSRRLLILGAVALPFLGLLIWSSLLIQATRNASRGFEHCSTWTLETSRHLGVIEDAHEKASGLLHSENPEIESAALEAALDRLAQSRQEFGRRTLGEMDPYLASVDRAISSYLAQIRVVRGLATELAELPEGPGKATRRLKALAVHAHLDHQHQTVLGSIHALARYHKDMLELAIQSSQRNAARLSMFAGVSLLIAIGFGVAGGLAIYQRYRSDLLAKFFQTLVDTIPDGVVAWGPSGEVDKLNPGMADFLGMPSLLDRKGLSIGLLFAKATLERLEAAVSGDTLRLNLFDATGAVHAMDAKVGRIDHPGGPTRLAILRDVSHQVERERRLLESQWQIEAGRRAGSLAKDLEYAMHPILLAQEILKPADSSSSVQMNAWETLHRTSEHAALMLRQFNRAVAAGSEESPEVLVFDLQVCLLELLESFHLDRGTMTGVEVDLDPESSPVRGPVNLVRRSLELVIQRALDVAGGRAAIQLFSEQEPGAVVVRILDPGQGESDTELQKMFDPVYCLVGSHAGDAFGLFNVAETLRNMGGEARIARTEQGWTEFTLRFPLEGAP